MSKILTEQKEIIELEETPFAIGDESTIYKILSPLKYINNCVKIYNNLSRPSFVPNLDGYIRKQKEEKIKYMLKNKPNPVVAAGWSLSWPTELVYMQNNKFVGFIMPMAPTTSVQLFSLINHSFPKNHNGNEWENFNIENDRSILNRMQLCSNISSALFQLHKKGTYVIGNLTPQNILVITDCNVTIIDLDSIQINETGEKIFGCNVTIPEYMPPESENIDLKNVTLDQSWDLFTISVIFYEVLIGTHPFNAKWKKPYNEYTTIEACIRAGLFPYGRKYKYYIPSGEIHEVHKTFSRLPLSIQTLFKNGLNSSKEKRPSFDDWGKKLNEEINHIKALEYKTLHTSQVNHSIPAASTTTAPVQSKSTSAAVKKKGKSHPWRYILFFMAIMIVVWISQNNKTNVQNPEPAKAEETSSPQSSPTQTYSQSTPPVQTPPVTAEPVIENKTIDYQDGSRYEGSTVNSKKEGYGTYYYPVNNEMKYFRYEGEFRNDMMNGQGVLYMNDGGKYEGTWSNDKRGKHGTYFYPSNNEMNYYKYTGDFNNNLKNGKGILYINDGSRYEGTWVNDKREGRFYYYNSAGKKEIHTFSDGERIK